MIFRSALYPFSYPQNNIYLAPKESRVSFCMWEQAPLPFFTVTRKFIQALERKLQIVLVWLSGKGSHRRSTWNCQCLLNLCFLSHTPFPGHINQFTLFMLPVRPANWKGYFFYDFSFVLFMLFWKNKQTVFVLYKISYNILWLVQEPGYLKAQNIFSNLQSTF